MAKKPKLIRVYANPFGAEADHEGRTHCHVHYEPRHNDDAPMRFVACRLIATQTQVADRRDVKGPWEDDFDHVWEYDTEPTIVPLTAYYMAHLRQCGAHGPALLPADRETWALVHGDAKSFRDPKAALAQFHIERGHAPRMKGAPETPADHPEGEPEPHVAHFRAWLGDHHTAAIAHAEASKKAHAEFAAWKPPAPPDKPTEPASPQALHSADHEGV